MEEDKTSYINTIHRLAREMLSKPDGFVTVTVDGREYVIEGIQRIKTHANMDDSVMHWTINTRDGGQGNLKK